MSNYYGNTLVKFNFNHIPTTEVFYEAAARKFNLPAYFGENADALFDSLSGDVALPLTVICYNLTAAQLEQFDDEIQVFVDAKESLSPDFEFILLMKEGEEDLI